MQDMAIRSGLSSPRNPASARTHAADLGSACLPQAEKRQDGNDDDHQADKIDDGIHGFILWLD
jgi:hypothetical protein